MFRGFKIYDFKVIISHKEIIDEVIKNEIQLRAPVTMICINYMASLFYKYEFQKLLRCDNCKTLKITVGNSSYKLTALFKII